MANCAVVGINWGDEGKLDPENLCIELDSVRAQGLDISPERLKISDRASLLLPWHRKLDELEEQRLKDRKYGSTKQGIAPFYSDKYQKKTVLAGELFHPVELREHLIELLEWKNLIITGVYGAEPYTVAMLDEWLICRSQGRAESRAAPQRGYACPPSAHRGDSSWCR